MPWTYNLGASVMWTLPVDGIDLKARLSVFNLLNDQEVIKLLDDEMDERDPLEELAIEIGSTELSEAGDDVKLEDSFQIKSVDDDEDDLFQ